MERSRSSLPFASRVTSVMALTVLFMSVSRSFIITESWSMLFMSTYKLWNWLSMSSETPSICPTISLILCFTSSAERFWFMALLVKVVAAADISSDEVARCEEAVLMSMITPLSLCMNLLNCSVMSCISSLVSETSTVFRSKVRSPRTRFLIGSDMALATRASNATAMTVMKKVNMPSFM